MKKLIKVVKRSAGSERLVKVPIVRNRWSKVIRSWVVELRQKEQELLPAFDSLFKKEVRRIDTPDQDVTEICLPDAVGVKAVD